MQKGILFIIACPLGNIEDITLRALKILRDGIDIVYCEDTRQTKKIFRHYDISLPVYSLHSHSSDAKIKHALNELHAGKSIGYCTDAGTPGISDPGARLVKEAHDQSISVIPIPGPSALTAIVSVSGFNEKNVIFGGFLTKKEGKRKKELQKFLDFTGTIVLYESPHRVVKLLTAIQEVFPDRQIVIGREMTKIFEQYVHGTAGEILSDIDSLTLKGEFTIAINNSRH